MISKDVAKSHVANLIKLAHADGKLAMNEVMFIQVMAHQLGITKDEFQDITSNLEGVRAASPWDMIQKKELFTQLVTMVTSDTKVHEEELNVINETGKGMGLPVTAVAAVVDKLKSHEGVISAEAVKALLN